jgi:hypothetical protein
MTIEPMSERPSADLARLGDDLERRAGTQLAASRRRGRTVRVAGGLAVAAMLLTATAAAAGLFSPKQVAAGLPASAVIFGNTHPVCVLDADGATFHCTLDTAPQSDAIGYGPDALPSGKAAADPGVAPDYLDSAQPIAIDGVITGGCRGRSSDGLHWDCWIGQDAVDQLILAPDMLGQPMTEPGRG